MNRLTRRSLLGVLSGGLVLGLSGPTFAAPRKVLVVGGGPGGTTAALTLKSLSPRTDVTLIERDPTLFARRRDELAALLKHNIPIAVDEVLEADWNARHVTGLSGRRFSFDQVIIAPGIGFRDEGIPGYDDEAALLMPHAWKRGSAEIPLLQHRLLGLPKGGTVIIRVPQGPISHPKGPYERATRMAETLSKVNPTARVIIVDGNADFAQRRDFEARWSNVGRGRLVEWTHAFVERVEGKANRLLTDNGWIKGDLINFIPAQCAGEIARRSGLTNSSGWCPTEYTSGRSSIEPRVWIVGDAVASQGLDRNASDAQRQAVVSATAVLASG